MLTLTFSYKLRNALKAKQDILVVIKDFDEELYIYEVDTDDDISYSVRLTFLDSCISKTLSITFSDTTIITDFFN